MEKRSIIPACDVSLKLLKKILKKTSKIKGVGAYKIGFELGLEHGLPKVVELIRKYTDKPIIYDHQKAGSDVPFTGKRFAKVCKDSGIDTIILFPQAGPATEKAWIKSALEQDLGVIVGGMMTHEKYVASEGGYLTDDSILDMYINAAKLGVSDFVAPGNKPDMIFLIRKTLVDEGINPVKNVPPENLFSSSRLSFCGFVYLFIQE